MIILFIPIGNRRTASTRVRCFFFAEALQEVGIRSHVFVDWRKHPNQVFVRMLRSDVIWFQKGRSPLAFLWLLLSKLLGKKIVFDFDDPLFIGSWIGSLALKFFILNADAVTVDSHSLLDYARKYCRNAFLIPDTLPLDVYKPRYNSRFKKDERVSIGWIGAGLNYEDDLAILSKPLERIGRLYDIEFIIVGAMRSRKISRDFENLENVKVTLVHTINWADPRESVRELSRFDIGVIPLRNTAPNSFKGSFKLYEYIAMGIPVVASPVGECRYVIKEGLNGFFASDEDDWIKKLSTLIEDKRMRRRIGRNGRKLVEDRYSIKACGERLKNTLLKLISHSKHSNNMIKIGKGSL